LDPPPQKLILCAGYLADVFRYYGKANIPLQPVMIRPGSSAQESLQALTGSLGNIQRFALVYSRPDHGDPDRLLPRTLEMHSRLLQKRHWTGVDVYVFEAREDLCGERLRSRLLRHRRFTLGWCRNDPKFAPAEDQRVTKSA